LAIDFYRNETTRHAHLILPPTFALERDHFEVAAFAVSVRNGPRVSPPLFAARPDQPHDWEICLELASRLGVPDGRFGRLAGAAMRRVGRRIGTRGLAALALW